MDLVILKPAIRDNMQLTKEESITYIGGAKLTAALITAVTTLVKSLYEWGQNFGSTVRRLINKTSC